MKPGEKKLQPIRLLQKAKDLQTRDTLNKLPKVGEFRDTKGEDFGRQEKKGEQFTAVVTKQSICESLLTQGYAQAFTDFFYITHDRTPIIIYPSEKFQSELQDNRIRLEKFRITEESIRKLQDKLIDIDRDISDENWPRVIDQYKRLAEEFKACRDWQVAAYYYDKCVNLATKRKDKIEMALAKKGFAECNDFFDRADEAIINLEEAIDLSHEHSNTLKEVSAVLIHIYKKMAQKSESDLNDPEEQEKALYYYQKCLDVCNQADNTETEGEIAYKIGQIYFKRHDYQQAVDKLKTYLQIAGKLHEHQGKKAKMEAFAALAQCYMKMDDDAEAMHYLEQYQALTSEDKGKNDAALFGQKADAQKHMANLLWKKGDRAGAIDKFKQFFEDAKMDKNDKNRKILDTARIAQALAKGTHTMDSHIEMVSNSRENIYDLVAAKYSKDKK